MGRVIDENKPYSAEDKQYLIERGRGYKIPANERRFGANGEADPVEGEEAGAPQKSVFYDNEQREKAVYDVGGAPLPGVVLDHDTGRAFDRENGVIVEPTRMGLTQSAHDLSAQRNPDFETGRSDDGDDIDADIAEFVLAKGFTVDKLKDRLEAEGVSIDEDDKKQQLQEKLAIKLQDDRDDGKEIDLS
jgi:hypothetical protein